MFYLKKATHSHNPIVSLSQSVITYCYQKNPLRVRTKLHILFYYAWSSQRFKSLPSILCKIAIRAKPVTCRTPVILSKTPYRPAIWTEVAGWNPACFLCYFLHAAKSNNPFPFRELSIAWKACPCRGSTLRMQGSFEVLQTSNQRTVTTVSHSTQRNEILPNFISPW